jgi:hypothetical protein
MSSQEKWVIKEPGDALEVDAMQEMVPLRLPAKGGCIAVPPNGDLALLREEARKAGTLSDLRNLIAAWQVVAERCDLVFDEMMRLAVFRLEVERDLGAQLAQTVKRGRPKRMAPGGTFETSLPEGISRQQSSAYQKLAAIPLESFERYLETVRGARKLPTSKGARSFAYQPTAEVRRLSSRKVKAQGRVVLSPDLLDACVRLLGEIDVVIGSVPVKAGSSVRPSDLSRSAKGSVLVVGVPNPADVLQRLAQLRERSLIDDAIVALPRDIDAGWMPALRFGPWSLCVPAKLGSPIIAHIGGHRHGFALVFAELGVVACVATDAK